MCGTTSSESCPSHSQRSMSYTLKQWIGVLCKDLPRYLVAFARGGSAYLGIRNRNERLQAAPDGSGYRCDWQWTSDLYAPKVMPSLARRLTRRALMNHPIAFSDALHETRRETPHVSFIIGHRGTGRLPHLLATLRSIAAQRGVAIECIVVEQDVDAQVAGHLPDWVRHVHTPPPVSDMPYCRSWTFNVGVKYAVGELLVLHDNDMLVPTYYAAKLLERVQSGYDVANLKRFVFYMSARHTEAFFAGGAGLVDEAPEAITQNLEGGGSVAITREAYARIGGMDERFVGWGGEDNEFWARAQTLRIWPYANLPIVHLWHGAQPGKHESNNRAVLRYHELSKVPVAQRIDRLRSLPAGRMSGPCGFVTEAP